jgi:anion-transporting  ArsA/GET3 family ATPase
MDLAQHIEGKQVVVCAGSGGVGKTTTSASIAIGMAERGLKVAVLTIDPAKRLADSLGLAELGTELRQVDSKLFTEHGLEVAGELHAAMLDPKRTFDDLIQRYAPDSETYENILNNRIYQELSNAIAGSQEYMAMEKLLELHEEGGFDLLILDTPPSRNALDFLDAPDRLTGFLEGRALKVFLAPTGLAAKVAAAGTSVVFGVLRRLTGVDLLDDLSMFFRSLSGLIDGFKERAEGVKALLGDPATTFLIVSSPEREAVEETIFFHGKLAEHGMPFGGLVVNRVHALDGAAGDADAAALRTALGANLAGKVGRAYAEEQALAERDTAAIERLRAETGDPAPALVPQLAGDVHDIDGLVAIHAHLFGLARAVVAPAAAP